LTVILCILAVIVAAVVAAACVLIGAFAGGQIGKALHEETRPSADEGTEIRVGDYVSVRGGLTSQHRYPPEESQSEVSTCVEWEHTRVFWFVEHATLHGHSSAHAPLSYKEPDANLPIDACKPSRPDIR
jgi:hypothetical protein